MGFNVGHRLSANTSGTKVKSHQCRVHHQHLSQRTHSPVSHITLAQVNAPKRGVLLQRRGQRQRAIVPHFIAWRDTSRSHTNYPGPGKASTVCRNMHTSKHTHRARLVGELATAATQFHFFATLLCFHFVLFSKVA
eukprot:EG_transcript_28915